MYLSKIPRVLALLASCLGGAACESEDLLTKLPDADIPSDADRTCTPTYAVFLNRGGGDYLPGYNDPATNRSSVLSKALTLPPYAGSDAVWNDAVACLEQELAPFRILVTDSDPGTAIPQMEVVVAAADAATFDQGEGTTAIAPFSCGTLEGISFVFGDTFPAESSRLCKEIGVTVAHMFGIENHFMCGDIASFDISGTCRNIEPAVVDAELQCGEIAPNQCQCTPSGTSNSYAILAEAAGLCP